MSVRSRGHSAHTWFSEANGQFLLASGVRSPAIRECVLYRTQADVSVACQERGFTIGFRPGALHLFIACRTACCASKQVRRYAGHAEKHRRKMTLAGKPHAPCNRRHRAGGCSKKFLSALHTDPAHIAVWRFAGCRLEGSRKVIRAHMNARSNIFEREPAGESCMDIVPHQLELPGTHPRLPLWNGEGRSAILAKHLRHEHLSSRIEEESSWSLIIVQLISKGIHDGGDQRIVLSEAVDDLNASWIALDVLGCEAVEESRIDADVNRLDSSSISSIPPNFGRFARRSQREIPRSTESGGPGVSIPNFGLSRSSPSREYQPGVRCGWNPHITTTCGLSANAYSQVSPIPPCACPQRRICEILLHLLGADLQGNTPRRSHSPKVLQPAQRLPRQPGNERDVLLREPV